MSESRTQKSLLNARVNLVYYFVNLLLSFFTRKIFLDCLGTEFMGLSATLGSVLGFLALTELGVGVAISYTLYKPLADKNQEEIKKIISIFGYIYSKIGYVILGLGIVVSLFFPWMFSDIDIPLGVIYFAFYTMLASSLFGYYLNYPSAVFSADQKGYEITRYSQAAAILRLLLSAAIVTYSDNLYLFLSVNIIFALISAFIIQWRIRKVYPWLKTSIKEGHNYLKEYPSIMKKTKQVFFHKLAVLGQYQLAPIIIYSLTTLTSVALYANYMLIVTKLTGMVNSFMGSTHASVGNLIAEGDKVRIKRIYYEMLSIRFFIAGYFTFMLYMLTEPFIEIWLGEEYLLQHSVLLVLLISTYIGFLRNATDQFIGGYGMFQDVWAPIVEAVLCISVSIGCGYLWGLKGVLMGNVVSLVIIVCIWKPYFLFKDGFGESVWEYWRAFALRFIIFIFVVFVTYNLYNVIPLIEITNFITFALDGIYLSILFFAIYVPLLYHVDRGFRDFANRTLNMIKKKI